MGGRSEVRDGGTWYRILRHLVGGHERCEHAPVQTLPYLATGTDYRV